MIDSRSPSFTPFGGSDFLMEEIDEFLEHDDSIPPGVDGIYDSEGDTVYLEELLSVINSDPNLPPSPVCEIDVPEKVKSSCEDPPDLELKDLPSHLEYAFLEGDDKLPVIIAKNLKDEDKTALIKIPIDPLDQEKTTFTCPYGTFAYRRMPFGLCNAPSTFQRCMVAIFHDIIESKSKVRNSQSKPVVAKVSACTSTSGISPDVSELKDMVKALLLDKKNQSQAPAHQSPTPVKAVEQSCVTCGGGHSYQNYPATDGNICRDNIQEYVSQAAAVNYNQRNASYRP
ncbi:hypothetical protein Tco_0251235 [Tanacetum coccineum]